MQRSWLLALLLAGSLVAPAWARPTSPCNRRCICTLSRLGFDYCVTARV
jgi:hypothetical protein